jgi:glutathione S-transferase
MPVLHDGARERSLPETSIIIEYLQQHYPGPVALLPDDRDACLQARLWDRFFDLYVSGPMQAIVGDRIRPAGVGHDSFGVEQARANLETAYATADAQLRGRTWATGESFTMADCAAAPALFYTTILQPIADRHPNLSAYFERLMARPSVARVIAEARPWFSNFPFVEAMPARFRNG